MDNLDCNIKNYGKHWMHVAMADDQYKLHKLGVPIQKICNFLNKKYGHRFSSRKTWIPDGNLTTKNQQLAYDKYFSRNRPVFFKRKKQSPITMERG